MIYRSESRTTDGQAVTGKGLLKGILVHAGVDAGSVAVYDGTSTAGRYLGSAAAAIALVDYRELPGTGVDFQVGLYLDVTGTTPLAVVYFT
jgi:hypothetical protein